MTVSLSTLVGATSIAGTLTVSGGGTGSTTLTLNSVLLGNGSSALQSVAPGTSGNVLTSNGTTWVSGAVPSASIGISVPTDFLTVTNSPLTSSGTIALSLATNPLLPKLLIGPTASANYTRYPNTLAVISSTSAGIQQNESHNIGLIAEGTAHATNTAIYGVGVYGVGYTNAGTRAGGVIGEGHVSATGDTGSAIGVRGYSNDTHSGGMNIGLFAEASGSATNNYALYMSSGNITNIAAQTWTLGGNLTFSGAYTVAVPTLSLTNALTVANGGTGAATLATNNVLLGNGTSALQVVAPSTTGNVLTSNGTTWISSTPTAPTALGTPGSGNFSTGTFTWPTFNQNTTGTAASFTSTTQNSQFNSIGIGTAASATAGEIRATNNITAYYSDERLKTNIVNISNALEKVLQLNGVTFNANDLAATYGYTNQSQQVGVIAQQVELILPQIVVPAPFDIGRDLDGNEFSISGENYKTVQYEKLVPLLIEAIKELTIEVNKLKGGK
jgi:hypothetical protein